MSWLDELQKCQDFTACVIRLEQVGVLENKSEAALCLETLKYKSRLEPQQVSKDRAKSLSYSMYIHLANKNHTSSSFDFI